MLSPQSSSTPPCPLSVHGPTSIPHVQSLSPMFSFFQSPLCSQFSFSAVTALIETHPDSLFHHSLSTSPCGVSSPRSLPSVPFPICSADLSKIRTYACHSPAYKCFSHSRCLKKKKTTTPKPSNALALPMVHGICLCLLSSSHPSTRAQLQRNTPSPRPTRRFSPPSPCLADASSSSHLTSSKPSAGRRP